MLVGVAPLPPSLLPAHWNILHYKQAKLCKDMQHSVPFGQYHNKTDQCDTRQTTLPYFNGGVSCFLPIVFSRVFRSSVVQFRKSLYPHSFEDFLVTQTAAEFAAALKFLVDFQYKISRILRLSACQTGILRRKVEIPISIEDFQVTQTAAEFAAALKFLIGNQ